MSVCTYKMPILGAWFSKSQPQSFLNGIFGFLIFGQNEAQKFLTGDIRVSYKKKTCMETAIMF